MRLNYQLSEEESNVHSIAAEIKSVNEALLSFFRRAVMHFRYV